MDNQDWICAHLKQQKNEKTVVLRFDPWRISGREDLIVYFLRRLQDEIVIQNLDKKWSSVFPDSWAHAWKIMRGQRDKAKDIVEKVLDMRETGAGQILKIALGQSPEQLYLSIAKKMAENGLHFVCVIDDLDRLEDQEIRDVAMLVKSVGNIKNASYLIAYDPQRVARALGGATNIEEGLQYLEKIVQLQLRIPAIESSRLRRLVYEVAGIEIGKDWRGLDWGSVERVMHDLIPRILWTPRDIIRFGNILDFRLQASKGVFVSDVLRFCALETRFPLLPERLSHLIYRCTVDGYRELLRRPEIHIEKSERVVDALLYGDSPPSETRPELIEEKALLQLLFPALQPGGTDRVARDIGRLCYESSLKRLLNYCSPLSELVADEAKNLVHNPQRMVTILSASAEQQHLRHAHIQLRTVYNREIKGNSLQIFWRALAEHFDIEPCYHKLKSWHEFTDLSHVWVRGIATGYLREELPLAADVEAWIDGGFLHLPSCFIYFASAALGEGGLQKRREFDILLPVEETQLLTKKLVGRLTGELGAETGPAIKSLYPLWVLKSGTESLDAIRNTLSCPSSQRAADRIVCLLYRTWKDTRVEDIDIRDVLDLEQLLPQIRRFSRREANVPFMLQNAYRFVREKIEAGAIGES